ncbi:MAG: mannose-6-phosphate isomerase, class I [Nesterenkonia sp.]|nr:mannose-6-phosphate isomerase, class I [Nesterenkonia sp.]
MRNPVQHYDWGSATAFADRFGWAADGRPQAELWMGAHPTAPSSVVPSGAAGEPVPLDRLFADRPELLGPSADQAELPFLLKVLAAASPLSIQTHPTAARAAAGFDAEEAAGVAPDARERMYPDRHHKPELIVALEDFTALCGFRPVDQSASDLKTLARRLTEHGHTDAAAALGRLAESLSRASDGEPDDALDRALRTVLQDDRDAFAAASASLAEVVGPTEPGLTPGSADTILRACAAFPRDPGVVVALLLNRVVLSPGQALYLPAGNLHSYLHGVGVEVMASSDNVLRGGLTAKHVDVEELVDVTDCAVLPVPRCTPVQVDAGPVSRWSYRPDCPEFRLDRFDAPDDGEGGTARLASDRASVLLCTAGTVELHGDGGSSTGSGTVVLAPGESALITAGPGGVTARFQPGTQAFLAQSGRKGQRRV